MQKDWQKMLADACALRRELHRQPELAWQEVQTAKRIRQALTALEIPWRACAGTGTVGVLAAQAKGKHIALRGDMDALAIDEKTEAAWASHQTGCMHACGHDGHTAALLASARWLKINEHELQGPVTLLFQPAEEGEHGAKHMIADGALEGVDEIYGWHNWPAFSFGEMVCPEGVVMCGNGTFVVTLTGKGGHASQPEVCRDPVLAASAITLNLQQIISRRVAPQSPVVVSVTSIQAPSGLTVIPETATLSGSIRVPDTQTKEQVNRWIEQICQDTARTYGVDCQVDIHPRYNATINHAGPAATARNAWQIACGETFQESSQALPVMASEDFSYYLETIPGAFALIGAADGPDHAHACHSPYYDFNDRLLEKVVRWYAQLVGVSTPNNIPSKTQVEPCIGGNA